MKANGLGIAAPCQIRSKSPPIQNNTLEAWYYAGLPQRAESAREKKKPRAPSKVPDSVIGHVKWLHQVRGLSPSRIMALMGDNLLNKGMVENWLYRANRMDVEPKMASWLPGALDELSRVQTP
jgi:hypothetical protein